MLLTLGEVAVEYGCPPQDDGNLILDPLFGTDVVDVLTASVKNGLSGRLITKYGNDVLYESLFDSLIKLGIRIDCSKAICDENEEKIKEKRYDYSEVDSASIYDTNLSNITAIYISGISQSLSPSYREAALKIVKMAKSCNITVYFAPNYKAMCWNDQGGIQAAKKAVREILPHIDVLLPCFPKDREVLPFDVVMPSHLLVVAKNGKEGITIYKFGQRIHLSGIAMLDGEDDTSINRWNGCFIALHQQGLPIKECVRSSNVFALNHPSDMHILK